MPDFISMHSTESSCQKWRLRGESITVCSSTGGDVKPLTAEGRGRAPHQDVRGELAEVPQGRALRQLLHLVPQPRHHPLELWARTCARISVSRLHARACGAGTRVAVL